MSSERSPRALRVAMLLHKSVEHDSRVRREARALTGAGHDVTVIHLPPRPRELQGELDGYQVVAATPPGWVRRLLPFHVYRLAFLVAFVRSVRRLRPDVVHAHDAAMLVPGWLGARLTGARLVYDSHELATGVPYRERLWATFVQSVEQLLVPRCAAVITVSDGIAAKLRELYGLDRIPAVVRNIPDLGIARTGTGLRARLGLQEPPLVLHLGAPAPGRGCEVLVAALAELPDSQLVFLGDSWPGYEGTLEQLADREGVADRVHFLPSVPVEEVISTASEADVGVSLLIGDCENHRLALPNKVFEYVAASVPVVVSELPELRALVERHGIGCTAQPEDAASVAAAIRCVLAERERLRPAVLRAGQALSWERERRSLTALYEQWRPSVTGRALVFVRNPCLHDARVLRAARLLRRLGFATAIVAVTSTLVRERNDTVAGIPIRRLRPGSPLGWVRGLVAGPRHSPGEEQRSSQTAPAMSATGQVPGALRRIHRLLVTFDWYRRGIGIVARERPALVHCNDYNTMWIGVAAKLLGARVVYDAHELWPDRNLRPEPRWWLLACEWLFVRVADQTITTSPAYAECMSRRYRTSRPRLIRNIPEAPPPIAERSSSDPRQLVYFGALTRGRGLERSIELLQRHSSLRLRIVGPDAWGFRAELERLAREFGVQERLELMQPVPPACAWGVLADADVALALIEPTCLSYVLTLPNKLFEYLLAGLPVLASDLPAIASFVTETGAGITVDPGDANSIDEGLRSVLEPDRHAALRLAARRAAERISWKSESEALAEVYGGPR